MLWVFIRMAILMSIHNKSHNSLESPRRGDSNEYPQQMCEAILMSTHNVCFYG